MLDSIVIIGAGGFGREVLDIIVAQNNISKKWKMLGFIDENPALKGKLVNGYPVLGSFEWFSGKGRREVRAVCAVGNNQAKRRLVQKAESLGLKFATIIHPNVVKTDLVNIGEGVIICAGCILTNQIVIGNHVILNLDVTIGHDTIIEDLCTLNPGVHVSGSNLIHEGVNIGTGAVTIQGMSIGRWSVIGAGAAVVRNIPEKVVAVGVPAKPIKKVECEYGESKSQTHNQ